MKICINDVIKICIINKEYIRRNNREKVAYILAYMCITFVILQIIQADQTRNICFYEHSLDISLCFVKLNILLDFQNISL